MPRLWENAVVLQRAKPSRDPVADALSWEKTKAEFSKQIMVGPFYTPQSLLFDRDTVVRFLNRFGLLERHGGAEEDSVRNIDDGKARGHNADSANTATHRPADLDAVGALSRQVAEKFPDKELSGFPSDFRGRTDSVLQTHTRLLTLSLSPGMPSDCVLSSSWQ